MVSKNNKTMILQLVWIFIIFIFVYGCIKPPKQEISEAMSAKKESNEKIIITQKNQAISSLDNADAALKKIKKTTYDAKLIGIENYEQEYKELIKLYSVAKDFFEKNEYQKSYEKSSIIYQKARRIELATKRAINLAKIEEKKLIESDNELEKENKKAFNLINHKVARGECLWIIAGYKQIYANPYKWPLIYKANSSKIKDPDFICPGQKLIIPRELTQEEINAAIYEANHRGSWSLFDAK